MKRCPECQFLYEDEQELCDMDGTVLRTTSFLPPLAHQQPIEKNGRPSIWDGLAITLLTLVVIGSVLVTIYRATPPKLSSSAPQPASPNQDTKLPVSDSPQVVTTPAIPEKSTDPFALPATRTQDAAANSSRPVQSTNEKRLTIEPATRDPFAPSSPVVDAPKAAPSQTSPPAPASQKAVTRPNAISLRPEALPIKPTPQSKTQNQDKDSRVKSLFKKAGRVLKKPF